MKITRVLNHVWLFSIGILGVSCSQNNSDKPAAEALAELGLTALAEPQRTEGPAAAEALAGGYGEPGASSANSTDRQKVANVTVIVPEGWRSVAPSSSMRVAEYVLPSSSPDGDASVAIFSGNWGSVENNIARWKGQFQGEGSASKTRAITLPGRGSEMSVAIVDISGTFSGGMGPNARSQGNSRMLGAIVDVDEGSAESRFLYVKLLGPMETVAQWESSFDEFIRSISQG